MKKSLWLLLFGLCALLQAAAPYGLPEYAAECERELGKIPTFRCSEGQEIPIYNSDLGQPITSRNHHGYRTKCDIPSILRTPFESWLGGINPCVPHARVGRSPAQPGFETQWVWFCRRYFNRSQYSDRFDDINMIGHNPKTGATCFFVSQLNRTEPTKRRDAGHSGQQVPAVTSQAGLSFWKNPRQIETQPLVTGGTLRCTQCHDADPFVHSPHIDQVTVDGKPDSELMVPSNPDGKYWIVGSKYHVRPEWKPKHLVSPEIKACTSCHRIGNNRGCNQLTNLASGTAYLPHTTDAFKSAPFMPADEDRVKVRPGHRMSQRQLDAVKFINECCDHPGRSKCKWEELPR